MTGGQADYTYLIDWNNDGDYSDTGEDVSLRLNGGAPVSFKYGRDSERALAPTTSAEGAFVLNNDSRDYSPDYASSPLAGNLKPGRPVRVTALVSAVTYSLFQGFIDDFTLDPQAKTASFTLTDVLSRFTGQHVSTALYQGLRTGDAIGILLDKIGWPAAARDLDPGATLIQYWWAEGDAGDELASLVRSEGPAALVTVDGTTGNFVFRDRHHRLTRTESLTSQATIRVTGSGTTAPLAKWPLGYDHGMKAVINATAFSVPQRRPLGDLAQVWTSDTAISVGSGETVQVTAQASDPFIGAVTPVDGIDYTWSGGGTPTVALTRDSGVTTTIAISSSGGAIVVRDLALRAYSLPVAATTQVTDEEPVSIASYGRKTWPYDAPWVSVYDASALGDIIIGQRAERLPTVSTSLDNYSDTQVTQQLTRDLSDRVTILDPGTTGLNADFYIEQIKHEITGQGNRKHVTTFSCERAPTQITTAFRFDTAGQGFDDGKFALTGLDDPAVMFRFDGTSGHRFDEGVFAT